MPESMNFIPRGISRCIRKRQSGNGAGGLRTAWVPEFLSSVKDEPEHRMPVSFVRTRNAAIRQDYEEISPAFSERDMARVEIAKLFGLSERYVANLQYGARETRWITSKSA
jgi:hypothetical protein